AARAPGDRLPPALPTRERLVDVRSWIASVRFGRIAVPLAVVAFAQAPVEQDGRRSRGERDVGRLHGTAEVGAEHGRDPVVPTSFSQLASELTSTLGKAAVAPARGHAELVVFADRVRLEDDGDRHAPDSTGGPGPRRCALPRSYAHARAAAARLELHDVAGVRGGDH